MKCPGGHSTVGCWSVASRGGEPRHHSRSRAELAINNQPSPINPSATNLAVLNNGTNADILSTNIGRAFVPKTPEAFAHDADGNLTNDARWTYTWDAENRLTSFTRPGTAPDAAKLKVDCQYDSRGRRMQKIVSSWNGSAYVAQSTNRFLYDGWNLVGIFDAQSSLLQSFTWGTDLSGQAGPAPNGAGGVGGLKAMTVHSGSLAGTYFYCYDGNGNVAALVAAADGSVAAQYEYGPFGEVLRATGPLAQANPFLFSTKFCDAETGFYYYGYRYYDPSTGRWNSRDPIEEEGGLNLYIFVGNRPTRFYDPYGLAWYDWKWIDPAANFAAGIGDALTMGLTYLARDGLHWNDQIDTSSGAYIAGEITETSVEVVVTFGGAGLRKYAARKTTEKIERIRRVGVAAYKRANKVEGGIIHHWDPLKGHPPIKGRPGGNRLARYPMPFEWEGNGFWRTMTRVNNKAEHDALHLALMRMETLDKLREATLLVRQAGNRVVQAVNDAGVAAQNRGECPQPVTITIEAVINGDRAMDFQIPTLE